MTSKQDRESCPLGTTLGPLLVGREAAAALIAVSVATWDRQNAAGKTPAPVKVGSRVLWRTVDLELWTLNSGRILVVQIGKHSTSWQIRESRKCGGMRGHPPERHD